MDEYTNLLQNGETLDFSSQEDISPWGSLAAVIDRDTTGYQITVAFPTLDIANRCWSSIKRVLEARHMSGVLRVKIKPP